MNKKAMNEMTQEEILEEIIEIIDVHNRHIDSIEESLEVHEREGQILEKIVEFIGIHNQRLNNIEGFLEEKLEYDGKDYKTREEE